MDGNISGFYAFWEKKEGEEIVGRKADKDKEERWNVRRDGEENGWGSGRQKMKRRRENEWDRKKKEQKRKKWKKKNWKTRRRRKKNTGWKKKYKRDFTPIKNAKDKEWEIKIKKTKLEDKKMNNINKRKKTGKRRKVRKR